MYSAEISRDRPSCILFLIDQSGSMTDPFGGEVGRSKADRLADAINRLLYELTIRCTKSQNEGPRNYYDVGLIGYGPSVGPAFKGEMLEKRDLVTVSEIAENPAQVQIRERKVEDGIGGIITEQVSFAIWLDPVAQNGTPMCQALKTARSVIEQWLADPRHQVAFPPIVINITDGESTDGDPSEDARAIRELKTSDGNVLLFNLHLSDNQSRPIVYPAGTEQLPDQFSKQLFEMSSPLPPHIREAALGSGYTLEPGARGFVFNADIIETIQFLDIGTRAKTLR